VWAGPSLSRGRVYVGSGNTLFTPSDTECFFPKKYTGSIRCFALPDADGSNKPEKKDKPEFKMPEDITFRTADISSEGTRVAGEVFAPKNPRTDKLPTIIMSHGWGGTAEALRPDAVAFARAGCGTRYGRSGGTATCLARCRPS
jgi:hypothetical protein